SWMERRNNKGRRKVGDVEVFLQRSGKRIQSFFVIRLASFAFAELSDTGLGEFVETAQISGGIIGALRSQAILKPFVSHEGSRHLDRLLFDGAPCFAFFVSLLNLCGLARDRVA